MMTLVTKLSVSFCAFFIFSCASGHFAVTTANFTGDRCREAASRNGGSAWTFHQSPPPLLFRLPDWLLGLSLTLDRLIAASAAGFAMLNINLAPRNANLGGIKLARTDAAAAREISDDKHRIL